MVLDAIKDFNFFQLSKQKDKRKKSNRHFFL